MDKPKDLYLSNVGDVFDPKQCLPLIQYFYQLGYINGCNDTLKEEIDFYKNEKGLTR